MDEIRPVIAAPLEYAPVTERPIPARPVWLLLPNTLAVATVFFTIAGRYRPFFHLVESHFGLDDLPGRWRLALICLLHLLTIPTAAWTWRLVSRPNPWRLELQIARALAAVWLIGIATIEFFIWRDRFYVVGFFSMAMLATCLVTTLLAFPRHERDCSPAIIVLSGLSATQITLCVGVTLLRKEWTPELFIAAMIAACQILSAGICVRIWRSNG